MKSQSLSRLTATEAAKRLRLGQCSVEELADDCLAQISLREPDIHAWSYLDPDFVRAQARELDREGKTGVKGLLHGIPIGVKDVILTHDMPTQYNSLIYQGFHPHIDAACIALLRNAGALIFGKTHAVEFASTGRKPPTCNPRDVNRTPGGSSSGSAASVADFHVPIALGTQTGGSMIRPASYCGVYAIKPTWNLVNRDGIKVYSATLDTLGWYGRCAEDLALLYDVFDAEKSPSTDLQLGLSRVAVCRSPYWKLADECSRNALTIVAEKLRSAGASVLELTLPSDFDDLLQQQSIIMHMEGQSAFLAEYQVNRELIHPSIRAQVENTAGHTRSQLCAAYDNAARCRHSFDDLANPFDAVLTLSAVGEAPIGLASTGDMTFNAMWTLLHAPCINIPCCVGPNGMPIGITLTGPRFGDRRLLAAAIAVGRLFAEPISTLH